MSDMFMLIDKLKKENKKMLVDELFGRGNVLAEEQKLIKNEQKSMANILTDLLKLKGKISADDYHVLLNELIK